VKIIIDLDPKLQRKLEVLAHGRGRTVSDVTAEILGKVLNRDGATSGSASEGLPAVPPADAGKKATADTTAHAQASIADLVFLLEPLIARLRLVDVDGAQRRGLLAEMQMLPQDEAVARLVALLKTSLG
jgi:predicted transcriptional regulator